MPAAGVVMIIAVVAIIAAVVYYLMSTIIALRQITSGLDEAIASVVEIIEKSAPVNDVVTDINQNLDAGALYPGCGPARPERLPRSPVIGADAPVRYDASEEVGGPRKRMPATQGRSGGADTGTV